MLKPTRFAYGRLCADCASTHCQRCGKDLRPPRRRDPRTLALTIPELPVVWADPALPTLRTKARQLAGMTGMSEACALSRLRRYRDQQLSKT